MYLAYGARALAAVALGARRRSARAAATPDVGRDRGAGAAQP